MQVALLALAIGITVGLRHDAWWRGVEIWFFGFGVSAMFANWSMIFINYIQHVHADPWSEHNHSRNFVGKLGNWLVFNNGFHTAHHESAGLHWSKLPEAHAKIAHLIRPGPEAGEHRRRTACGRTCSGSSATSTAPTRWARRPYDAPDGEALNLETASVAAVEAGVNASMA